MPMNPHPTSFGVFKPVDHVLMSFADAAAADAAVQALRDRGFPTDKIYRYTPDEMRLQTEQDIHNANALAGVGQDLNLVRAHHALTLLGQSFVVVHAPHEAQVLQVTEIALRLHATRAQRYGSLLIEELVSAGTGEPQVAESSDRGLDAQTPSGVEGAGAHGTLVKSRTG